MEISGLADIREIFEPCSPAVPLAPAVALALALAAALTLALALDLAWVRLYCPPVAVLHSKQRTEGGLLDPEALQSWGCGV